MKSILTFLVISLCPLLGLAQSVESEIEAEVDSVQGKAEIPPPEIAQPTPPPAPKKKTTATVDEEIAAQEKVLQRKQIGITEITRDRNLNRYPTQKPLFKKPPGPVQGGTVRVEHPRAPEGLIRINKDGSYQYKTELKEKSKSSSMKIGMMSPPKIDSGNANITYETMYGERDVFSFNLDFEWQPFRSFGSLGFRVGTGLATATASGYFKNQDAKHSRSEEKYTLFMVPASAFVTYRFEFVRRQWVVPYVTGGATYFGLAEFRSDNASPSFAAAPAAGGGGGLLLNVSRLNANSAFNLSEEYGIADMWLVVEALAMQGLSDDIDFTSHQISAGIQVDF